MFGASVVAAPWRVEGAALGWDYLGRRTLDTIPWPPNLAWHCARSAVRFFALMRLLVLQFADLQEHMPITSARLAEGISSTTASAYRDARTQPRLRAMSTLSILKWMICGDR
jgi:hypothetical protein